MRFIVTIASFFLISFSYGNEKLIYQYKKYEKFDLGNLEVKGQLVAPGDISVRDRERRRFELELFSRKDFEDLVKRDVESLR
jgi:hypothetical protein